MEANHKRPLKSHEWVMNDIKRQLQAGELVPGDRLSSVTELASSYGVGQSTIREALSALKAMGMLTIRQGSGTYVSAPQEATAPPSFMNDELWASRATSLRHILEVRKMLETGCAALAATNRTEADVTALAAIIASMRERLDDEAFNEQADIQFHQQLAAATHNPILTEMMESLSAKLHDSMRDTRALWFYSQRSSAERLLNEHQAIYEAILEQNAPAASLRMEEHIAKVEKVLITKLSEE
ncbi:FadR/GntR family transcriptional regulator [Paenibacillus paridis]|uniref:FadR/GntR family transcriptional regulator n=1 Tax=Paenibacillus paridis TaxID=2583376 RepID=UPI001123784E|nr:FadR/GntR family transcriptional regulator [Paenibacillus paridis]